MAMTINGAAVLHSGHFLMRSNDVVVDTQFGVVSFRIDESKPAQKISFSPSGANIDAVIEGPRQPGINDQVAWVQGNLNGQPFLGDIRCRQVGTSPGYGLYEVTYTLRAQ